MWSRHSEEKGYAFNGFAVSTEDGTVLIDPPDPGEDGWLTIDLLEPFAGVWLTNRNHSRAAAAFRDRYGLTVWAHQADADRLEAGADRTLQGRDTIAGGVEVVPVPGKSPGGRAYRRHGGAKAVRGAPARLPLRRPPPLRRSAAAVRREAEAAGVRGRRVELGLTRRAARRLCVLSMAPPAPDGAGLEWWIEGES
jgi:hypothetical protein